MQKNLGHKAKADSGLQSAKQLRQQRKASKTQELNAKKLAERAEYFGLASKTPAAPATPQVSQRQACGPGSCLLTLAAGSVS